MFWVFHLKYLLYFNDLYFKLFYLKLCISIYFILFQTYCKPFKFTLFCFAVFILFFLNFCFNLINIITNFYLLFQIIFYLTLFILFWFVLFYLLLFWLIYFMWHSFLYVIRSTYWLFVFHFIYFFFKFWITNYKVIWNSK